jgi:hypothetical protein
MLAYILITVYYAQSNDKLLNSIYRRCSAFAISIQNFPAIVAVTSDYSEHIYVIMQLMFYSLNTVTCIGNTHYLDLSLNGYRPFSIKHVRLSKWISTHKVHKVKSYYKLSGLKWCQIKLIRLMSSYSFRNFRFQLNKLYKIDYFIYGTSKTIF